MAPSRSACLFASLGALVAATDARAEGSRPDFVLHEPAAEAVFGGVSFALNASFLLPQHEGTWGPIYPYQRDDVASSWSDMTGSLTGALLQLGMGYALESGYLALEGSSEPAVDALYSAAVEAESVFVATAATGLLKRLFGRCRPRAYEIGKCGEHDSFPSGHTSAVSAFGGARFVRLVTTDYGGPFALHAVSFGIAEVGSVVTGVLRVLSGAHGWDDVVVGGVVGHAAGFFVALAHPIVAVDGGNATAATRARGGATGPTFVRFSFPF